MSSFIAIRVTGPQTYFGCAMIGTKGLLYSLAWICTMLIRFEICNHVADFLIFDLDVRSFYTLGSVDAKSRE